MTLAFESGLCTDLDKRQVARTQEVLSALDAPLGQILLWSNIRRQLERSREVELAQSDRLGDAG